MNKSFLELILLSNLFFICISCNKISKQWNSLDSIVIDHTIKFELDYTTTPIVTYPQFYSKNGIEYLSTINVIDNSIKIFEFKTGKLFSTIDFNSDGPDKLTDLLSFHIINSDSLFYLDKIGNLYLLNSNSSIISKWNSKDVNEKGLPLFYENILPISGDFKSEVIFPNYYTTQVDRKLFFILNLKENKYKYKVTPPDEFVNGFYGIGDFGNWNFVRNKDGYFISFPNIKEIFHYDDELSFVKKIDLFFEEPIPSIINPIPLNFDIDRISELNENEVKEKLRESFVYGYLLFDEKSEKFVRFLSYPISPNSQYEDERKYSILIFDKNFELIKEWKIPFNEYYISETGFFTNDGFLYLQKKINNEDEMLFEAISLL